LLLNTTIQIPTELRDQLKEFGNKGETYAEIIARTLTSAKERQLHDLLMDEKGTISIAEARKRLNR
jgi:hypothetical protein